MLNYNEILRSRKFIGECFKPPGVLRWRPPFWGDEGYYRGDRELFEKEKDKSEEDKLPSSGEIFPGKELLTNPPKNTESEESTKK